MAPKVLFIDTVHPVMADRLNAMGYDCVFDYASTKSEIQAKIQEYAGIVIRSRFKIDRDFLDEAKALKFIARSGAGMENIDTEYAESKNISCIHAPEGNMNAVGEHALGMLLALANNMLWADQEVRNGIWKREENRGFEIEGKTVGIIGYGNMGNNFARCISGLNCEVIAYDLKSDYGNNFAKAADLPTLLSQADIISIHTPQDETTLGMVNDEFLSRCRDGVIIINTARGKIIQTQALVNGLKSGKVGGACLDVLEFEKASFEQLVASELPDTFRYLIESKKVILSPHVAGWTHESYRKLSEVMANKVEAI